MPKLSFCLSAYSSNVWPGRGNTTCQIITDLFISYLYVFLRFQIAQNCRRSLYLPLNLPPFAVAGPPLRTSPSPPDRTSPPRPRSPPLRTSPSPPDLTPSPLDLPLPPFPPDRPSGPPPPLRTSPSPPDLPGRGNRYAETATRKPLRGNR